MQYAVLAYCILLCLGISNTLLLQPTWHYEILEIYAASDNESLAKPHFYKDRIKRTTVVSAEIDWNYDCNDTYVEVLVYRSVTGTSDYKLTPFHIQRIHFTDLVNTLYQQYLYPKIKDCTNFPKIVGIYSPPWEHKIYRINKCLPSTKDLPTYMMPGYYKAILMHTGEVNWNATLIVQLFKK